MYSTHVSTELIEKQQTTHLITNISIYEKMLFPLVVGSFKSTKLTMEMTVVTIKNVTIKILGIPDVSGDRPKKGKD